MKSKTPAKRLIRILPRYLQSTANNSNLQGKSQKVRVIVWDGREMQISCSLHFKGSKTYTTILKTEWNNKAWLTSTELNIVFKFSRTDKKKKSWFEINSMFWTAVHYFISTCHVRKTGFELSRVKLYRNNLKGNKNYFELSGVDCMYVGLDVWWRCPRKFFYTVPLKCRMIS